jgi:hypothetical protein
MDASVGYQIAYNSMDTTLYPTKNQTQTGKEASKGMNSKKKRSINTRKPAGPIQYLIREREGEVGLEGVYRRNREGGRAERWQSKNENRIIVIAGRKTPEEQ